jgi:hypothetical protein
MNVTLGVIHTYKKRDNARFDISATSSVTQMNGPRDEICIAPKRIGLRNEVCKICSHKK